MVTSKANIIAQLQREILLLQGFKPGLIGNATPIKLGPIDHAFPHSTFPLGAIHEFISDGKEADASTVGFTTGLLSSITHSGGAAIWISSSRTIFPPGLKLFGIAPDKIIFIDVQKEKDVLWAMEEALKCNSVAAVVGEMQEISFTNSRRLQLAVEQTGVTGFILRKNPRKLNTTACVSRWKITPLPTNTDDGLPGLGFPQWNVQLLKVRNGCPGNWQMQWVNGKFQPIYSTLTPIISKQQKKAG